MTISANPAIPYQTVIGTMDAVRKNDDGRGALPRRQLRSRRGSDRWQPTSATSRRRTARTAPEAADAAAARRSRRAWRRTSASSARRSSASAQRAGDQLPQHHGDARHDDDHPRLLAEEHERVVGVDPAVERPHDAEERPHDGGLARGRRRPHLEEPDRRRRQHRRAPCPPTRRHGVEGEVQAQRAERSLHRAARQRAPELARARSTGPPRDGQGPERAARRSSSPTRTRRTACSSRCSSRSARASSPSST